MFIIGVIQRKLTSLLQPWLSEEPQLEVELGFFRSLIVAKNLKFDTSALNNLINGGADGGDEFSLLFKSVTVDEVVVRVAHWSAPAFTVEIKGINVTLFLEKRGVVKVDKSVDDYLKERKKKIIAGIDRAGSTLHDNIVNMMITASPKSQLKDSITNLLLLHCCFHLHDARIRVEYPVLDDTFAWVCYSRELNAQSSHKELGCLLGGLIGLVFVPLRETSFNLEASKLEIEVEKKDHCSCIFSCVNPYFATGLKDLQVVNSAVSVLEMNFSFSPTQLQMIGAFNNVLNIERKHVRSGRLLWGIVRWKIHNPLLPPGCMFYRVVLIAVLWLRLVKEYLYFLLLVGYSEHGVEMPNGDSFSRLAEQQLKMISDKIEKGLPAEAITSARRVARYRAALKEPHAEGIDVSSMNRGQNSFWKIILPLAFIWKSIVTMLVFVFRLHKKSLKAGKLSMTSEVSDPRRCFHLSLGKISVVVSFIDATCPSVHKKSNSRKRTSYTDVFPFLLLAKGFLFNYEEGISEQYISFTLGVFEVTSAPVFHKSENKTKTKNVGGAVRGHLKERLDGSETIVWGEPALTGCHSEEGETGHEDVPILERLSVEMELIWKRMQLIFEESKGNYDGNPWALCAMHTFWVHPGFKCPDSGFSRYIMMLGKLNITLGHAEVLCIATLRNQVQHALCHYDGSVIDLVPRSSLRTVEESQEIDCSSGLKYSIKAMNMSILKLLPDKHVEVKAVISGLRVQISVRNEKHPENNSQPNSIYDQNGVNLTIDLHNTEFAIWPTAKSVVVPCEEHQRPDNFESEFFKLEEPVLEGLSGSVNMEYASKGLITHLYFLRHGGLKVYFEDLVDNHLMQVLLLKPMTAKLSSLRDYLYTFARSVIASSLSIHGSMSGVTGSFYMDELSVILQVIESLFSGASTSAPGSSGFRAIQNNLVISENQFLQTGPLEEIIGVSKETDLSFESAICFIRANFELSHFDIILHNSRNGTAKQRFSILLDTDKIKNLGLAELPTSGIWISAQKTCIKFSIKKAKSEANANFFDFRTIMFRYKNRDENADKSEVENAVINAVDCMHEVSFSKCTFTLLLDCQNSSGAQSGAGNKTSNSSPKGLFNSSPLVINSLNSSQIQDEGSESNVSSPAASYMLLMNTTFDKVYMGTCSFKNGLYWAHPANKFGISLSIGKDFQSIIFGIQGGHIFMETTVLAGFTHCLTSYLQFMRSLIMHYPHKKSMETAEGGSIGLGKEHTEQSAETKTSFTSFFKQEILEVFSIKVSQLSLVLLVTDEYRVVKEITVRVDLSLKLWLENRKKKFLFDLSQLDIFSLVLNESMVQSEKKIQMPHFSSVGSSYDSLRLNHEDSTVPIPHREKTSVLSQNASCSSPLASMKRSFANVPTSPVVQSTERFGNFILEQLTSCISAEKLTLEDNSGSYNPTQGWVGNGFVSGLNLTISLSEIQMLLATVESLSEVSGKGATTDVEESSWTTSYQESEKDVEATLPDGAIVTIQDVHQHMYVTVESMENKYKLGGTVHYSLAGKRALFRVKWQKRRVWNFSGSWFSLMSLYAKSDSGVPLRLNYSGSSGFVGISSNDDSACALWKIASCKNENYNDDVDLEPLSRLCKNTYYLVNKKNDCGAAFVNGAMEFVKKPGNPFKFKKFQGFPVAPDLRMPETRLPESHTFGPLDGQNISEEAGMVPCISLTIEKISLIIVHELSDPKDKLPLLQGSVDGTQLIIQILPQKTRVISTSTSMLYYFDAHRTMWREFVQPIEICIYWRSTSPSQVTGISNPGTFSHLYFRLQELDLSLTEILLDMLLYVVGKLDMAGPFAVRNSAILANCCKVENQLDLDLLCHFHNNESVRVCRKQSAFFTLRHLAEPPESYYATILLENPGVSSTSSVDVPLNKNRIFAWRTRIKSQDSRTSPGPFIVFDISKNAEEGLSLNVSPLLRIHNDTGFSVELRIQRPESMEAESASVLLREGDTVDDCMAAFDAVSLSGGPKKALLSLGVGNFVFSFRPKIKEEDGYTKSCSVEWSENLKGEKAVRLSGIIDKLNYQVRKAFSAESWKYSFSTAGCSVKSGDTQVAQMHFLVQCIERDVPIMQPNDRRKSKNSSIALQEQKEIFLLPTVRVSNLLESNIDVLLTEAEISTVDGLKNINQSTIQCGSTVDLYANPAVIYFNITLAMFSSSCKPVNCSRWLKNLNNKKDGLQFLDIDLEFCGGMFFACLRLARGNRGILEATVFTQYTLRNDTDFLLFCAAPHLKPLSRDESERHTITTPPHLGTLLPPKSTRSWFIKSSKLCMSLVDEESPKSNLDLDALSGLAEIKFNKLKGSGIEYMVKLGISLGPLTSTIDVPARMVYVAPRYIISNESTEQIFVRQCFLEDDSGETVSISSKQKTAFFFRVGSRDKWEVSVFNKLLQKHKVSDDDASIFVQFSPNETVWGWSGPVCVASLGCFFLKFRRHVESPVHQLDLVTSEDEITWEFASVHVAEEGSTFALHFYRPPDTGLPYRIENHLHDASITYYQKDTFQPETLASEGSVSYVWDDLTRPHKLVVKINGTHMLREISLDKLRPWKSFSRVRNLKELAPHLPLDTRVTDKRRTGSAQMNGTDVGNVGYEVYADGPTRVLRISHSAGRHKADINHQSCKKIQLRISYFAIRLLEPFKQAQLEDVDPYDLSTYKPIIIGRLENISIDSIIINQRKYNQIRVQSMHIDEKWVGAPFAAMLRRHLTSNSVTDDSILFVVFVLFPTSSSIRDVRYSSIILQPVDLNLDEETLMKVVPFWRTSLSSSTQSQQYYFDHFEIHPIKITASFLPEDSYSSYSSGQEALRSLLHSVIKIPAIKNLEVELNGIFVTHALVTTRELLLRCARHYSWYGMRAIYIAKGSSLLPPTFASAFDDLASSSLDVFFDPSSSLFNVQGLTLGTFKLIRKCIKDKGFSGSKRYFGDLSKTLKNAGSNILFAAVTEISDSVLKGAESSGVNGMVIGFHHGILRLAMEPSLLGTAFLEGGPDRKIKLDRSPGIDELYVEGYLQAMLDTLYKQEYMRVRVVDDQVILKNLPPNSSLIDEIMERVKDFLISKALLKGDSTSSRPLRHLRGENEWRIGPTILTLCEHLFVSFAIRTLRKQTDITIGKLKLKHKWVRNHRDNESGSSAVGTPKEKGRTIWRWGIGKFALSALVAYVDGRLCRCIPHPVARRIVSGFLLSFLDNRNNSK